MAFAGAGIALHRHEAVRGAEDHFHRLALALVQVARGQPRRQALVAQDRLQGAAPVALDGKDAALDGLGLRRRITRFGQHQRPFLDGTVHLDGGLFLIQPARVHRGPDPCRARELGGLGHVHEMRGLLVVLVLLGLVERACRLVQRQLAHQAAVVLGRFHLGHDGADGGCGRSLGHGQFNQFFARE